MVDDAISEQLHRLGVLPIAPHLALMALGYAHSQHETSVVIANIDWARFLPTFTAARPSGLFQEVPEVRRILAAESAVGKGPLDEGQSWTQRMASLSEAEQDRAVTELVRTTVANVLGYAPSARIDTNRKFRALGFDSLSAVQLRNRLNATTGLRFSATTIFDYPTPTALIDHLRTQLVPDPTAASQSVMTDLDKLEATLSTSNISEQEHAEVAARLQALLRTWNAARNTTEVNLATDDTFQTATDDELFEALDQELGSSTYSY
jgi:acyl carrier protein